MNYIRLTPDEAKETHPVFLAQGAGVATSRNPLVLIQALYH